MKKWRLMVCWLALFLARPAMAAQPSLVSLVTNGLFEPYGLAVDGENNVYLADNSHRVFKYVYDNGTLAVLAGQQGQTGTNSGPGFLSRFYAPKGLALFAGGLVVADSGNHALRLVSLTTKAVQMVTPFAGVPATNSAGAASLSTVPASQAKFNTPLGLTADGPDLFVADSKNSAIRRIFFDTITGVYMVETLAISFVDPVKPFFEPSAIIKGGDGNLYVSDTRNQYIRQLIPQPNGTYAAFCLAGSVLQIAGTNDAFFARDARFNLPVGLCWVGGTTGLLIADSGNHTIRRAFIDANLSDFFGSNVWSVSTYGGTPKQPGLTDGYLDAARLKSPLQIVQDHDGGILVVDAGNQALRRIQIGAVQPSVTTPVIGYITYEKNNDGILVTRLVPITDATFNDEPVLAISGERRTVCFISGPTPGLDEEDKIPLPKPGIEGADWAPYYANGMTKNEAPLTLAIKAGPDITIKAVGVGDSRHPSPFMQAQVHFKVMGPLIEGNNPHSLMISDTTPGAAIYYTLTDTAQSTELPQDPRFAIEKGKPLTLSLTGEKVINAQAFRTGWHPSEITSIRLSPTVYEANRISLGFASGQASSGFVAAPGQRFYAPVTLTLLPNQTIYSLQFNFRVAPIDGGPLNRPRNLDFLSMLKIPDDVHPGFYATIPPVVFVTTPLGAVVANGLVVTDETLTQGVFAGLDWSPDSSLLMAGWLERFNARFLYNTKAQDLITYSEPHNDLFLSGDRQVVLGACGFDVPATAPLGTSAKRRDATE